MKSLTIVYVTARKEPNFEWFLDSLARQCGGGCTVVAVDLFHRGRMFGSLLLNESIPRVFHVPPKPTVWQGHHRLTKADWWAKSNSLNTGICLCKTEWICFVDDRSVLMPGWLDCIREAMTGGYCVVGGYDKRHNLKVENGVIIDSGTVSGQDCRNTGQKSPVKCGGSWVYGCTIALPLGWALAVNGFSEDYCDGYSAEDTAFGQTLENSGFPILFDPRMKIVEDRTPDQLGAPMRREDKGVAPNSKSHALVKHFKHAKASGNSFDIRKVRDSVLSGNPFPMPSASDKDWYDQQPLSEMV